MSRMIQTHALTKRYGPVTALSGCTLAVDGGEVFGLLGPNGAGKTTLLRLLLGFLKPSSGRAAISGWDCCRQSVRVRSLVSYLPGEVRLFRPMRAKGVLQFFAEMRLEGDLPRSLELADRLELDLSRRVASMSTGMRQKLALAVTLAVRAPLLILDEPTSNLDPTIRRVVLDLVREAQRDGRTVIFSSHVLSEVESVCDRVAFLRDGELVHVQPMDELQSRHRIQAKLRGPLPPLPAALQRAVTIRSLRPDEVTIETAAELAPLLRWLAAAALSQVTVSSLGLQPLYHDLHHPAAPAPQDLR